MNDLTSDQGQESSKTICWFVIVVIVLVSICITSCEAGSVRAIFLNPTATATTAANATETKVAMETATAEAKAATETAAAETATAEAKAATATAIAEAATAEARAAEETAAAETATAAEETAAAETATAEAKAAEETAAAETATAEAKAVEETAVAETATAEAKAAQTAITMAATATAEANIPTPEAVVISANGLELRDGPGTDDSYHPITTLPKGTALTVLRPVVNKPDWIKVLANLESTRIVTGYVITAPESIQINVDLADIPPIFEYGPHLIDPKPFEQRANDHFITFKWENKGLQEGQCYSLIIYRTDLSPGEACFHYQYEEMPGEEAVVDVSPIKHSCTPGEYYWGVGIATPKLDTSVGPCEGVPWGAENWRDDSERDERNIIGLSVVPRDKPSDGGEGGGGGGGDGGGTVISVPKP